MNYKTSLIISIISLCLSCNYKKKLHSESALEIVNRKNEEQNRKSEEQNKKKEEQKPFRDLEAFPKATPEQNRHLIYLPKKDIESNFKVQLYIGIVKEIDCNGHLLSGNLETKTVHGWGFDYWEFQTNGNITTTLMGCPGIPRRKEFVYFSSDLIRYNSRLPIVIYTPKGYQVKYKVWATNEELIDATQDQ